MSVDTPSKIGDRGLDKLYRSRLGGYLLLFRRSVGRKVLDIAEYLLGQKFEPVLRGWSIGVGDDGQLCCLLESPDKTNR